MSSSTPSTDPRLKRSDRIMGSYLVFVAIRCTLQYVVFPFVLPFLGLGGSFSAIISLVLEVFALGMMAYNVWQLWDTSWRWRYLALSAMMSTIVVIFIVLDVRALMGLN